MTKKTTLCTMTLPGRKRPQLYYRVQDGGFASLAILTVTAEEFWRVLSNELGIKWVQAAEEQHDQP